MILPITKVVSPIDNKSLLTKLLLPWACDVSMLTLLSAGWQWDFWMSQCLTRFQCLSIQRHAVHFKDESVSLVYDFHRKWQGSLRALHLAIFLYLTTYKQGTRSFLGKPENYPLIQNSLFPTPTFTLNPVFSAGLELNSRNCQMMILMV